MKRIDWQGVVIPKVQEILGSYSYRPTLRQVYYRLISVPLIPNTDPPPTKDVLGRLWWPGSGVN